MYTPCPPRGPEAVHGRSTYGKFQARSIESARLCTWYNSEKGTWGSCEKARQQICIVQWRPGGGVGRWAERQVAVTRNTMSLCMPYGLMSSTPDKSYTSIYRSQAQ